MTVRTAYNRGVQAALVRFKMAGPLGADYGVAPSGPEVSHGTDRRQYAPVTSLPDQGAEERTEDRAHRLWDLSEYDRLAPGMAGNWGQEVIG